MVVLAEIYIIDIIKCVRMTYKLWQFTKYYVISFNKIRILPSNIGA